MQGMSRDGYTVEEVARRGRQIYEQEIRAGVEEEHAGKFLVVDIATGEYEIAAEDVEAFDRALAKNPAAILYGIRVGEPVAYRLGASRAAAPSTRPGPWR